MARSGESMVVVVKKAGALPPRAKLLRPKWTGSVFFRRGMWVAALPRSGKIIGRFTSPGEAESALERRLGVLALTPPSAAMPVSAWVRIVLERRVGEGYRDERAQRSRIVNHVDRDEIGSRPLGEVTELDARKWLGRRQGEGGGGEGARGGA